MINKDKKFKQTKEGKEAFDKIKEFVEKTSTLRIPNFDKEFILYMFSFDHLIAVVLTQKNEDGEEFLVSFMSRHRAQLS